MEALVPTPECWQELGELRAEVDSLKRQREEDEKRIRDLEHERARLGGIGAVVGLSFTAMGVLFADQIRLAVLKVANFIFGTN